MCPPSHLWLAIIWSCIKPCVWGALTAWRCDVKLLNLQPIVFLWFLRNTALAICNWNLIKRKYLFLSSFLLAVLWSVEPVICLSCSGTEPVSTGVGSLWSRHQMPPTNFHIQSCSVSRMLSRQLHRNLRDFFCSSSWLSLCTRWYCVMKGLVIIHS